MKLIARLILTGALAVLPLFATIYLAFWLLRLIEESFGLPIKWAVGEDRYIGGMGMVLAIVICLLSGILVRTPPARRVYGHFEQLVMSIPIVKSVYGALRDFFGMFGGRKGGEEPLQVVEIDLPGTDMRMLGFMTRTAFADLPDGLGGEGDVAVYLPMSYQVGGYTVFVPRARVRPVNMSREDAMRFVLMAWVESKATPQGAEKAPG